jgi:hypothetical protein
MEEGDIVSKEHSEQEQTLRNKLDRSERVLDDLETDLRSIDSELEELAQRNHQYDLLGQICHSLEELDGLGAKHLFWGRQGDADESVEHLARARRKIDEFGEEVAQVEERRQAVIEKINDQNDVMDYLHYDLQDAIEREESRRREWVVERDIDSLPHRAQVMPWARGCEEDDRFRKSLVSSLAACLLVAFIIGMITIPIVEREKLNELPERVAKIVRQERTPPPPPQPIEQPPVPDEEIPEPEPELAEEQPPDELPEQPKVADVEQPDTREQVKSKGILAFRDSFADRANMKPIASLGSEASVSRAGEDAIGRPERLMVSTSAPGSSGGINLSNISRNVGGGGQGIEGVQLARVASSIGGGDGPDRPLSGGAMAGRTDEEIQIVFDRYKAALYRLYNRELRKDPTLRRQLVLQLTIEPDGTVSLCQLHSSDMNAPLLAQQVVDRVLTFDFGAKEDIVAMTIIYPIDFLPAA